MSSLVFHFDKATPLVCLSLNRYTRSSTTRFGKGTQFKDRSYEIFVELVNALYHRPRMSNSKRIGTCTNEWFTHQCRLATPLRLIAPTCNDGIKWYAARIMTKVLARRTFLSLSLSLSLSLDGCGASGITSFAHFCRRLVLRPRDRDFRQMRLPWITEVIV